MPDRHLIRHATPTVGGTTPWPLPEDLLREASRRLGVVSLLGAVLWVVATVLYHAALAALGHRGERFGTTDGIAAAGAIVSVGLFLYTRRSKRDPRFILDLGLVYMVLTAAALGLVFHWHLPPGSSVSPVISWIGAVVLIFAAIVPGRPVKMLVAGLLAVSMNPVGMLISRARGVWDFGPISNAFVMHYPDFLLVGVAVVISHVLTKLGSQIAKERAMGSYELGELLGRGGMGEVYRAKHRMLARPAAIKLIRPEMIQAHGEGAEIAMQRFRREAEIAASLRSPHTVALYDFGVTEYDALYFVMELLDGLDLETLVRRHGPVPPARAIYILRQVCDSLEEAHARGLVHRDVKPANIHVGRVGLHHDFVKVLDFGLAKSTAPGDRQYALVTAAGLTPGTPAYMAPEMAMGGPVDERADIYAVGCVAYFLLTGRLVFEADNVVQMIAMLLRDEPAPPSSQSVFPVPHALDRLVLAALAKKPEERPRHVAELSRALGAIDVDPWDERQAAEWWRLHADVEAPVEVEAGETLIVTAMK